MEDMKLDCLIFEWTIDLAVCLPMWTVVHQWDLWAACRHINICGYGDVK